MSLSVEGMCTNLIVNGESKEVRFIIQDSDGTFYTCDYSYDDCFPLRKGDMVSAIGDWTQKINNAEFINVFQCSSITARYEFDLFNFLMTYMPYQKIKEEKDIENVTKFYRDCTNNIIEYCSRMMGSYTIDNLNTMFNFLYKCITNGDNDSLTDFAKNCFKNPDLKKIKSFFRLWNNNVLIRPLQLLGLSEKEINKIIIPLYEAYEIAKTNPYRLPQIPIEKATKIITHHLRLEHQPDDFTGTTNHEELEYISTSAFICGVITRMVYDNIEKRKWTSTPVVRIVEKFPMYSELKEYLEKYYYCIEDMENVYFQKIYNIEVMLAKYVHKLYSKSDVEVKEPAFPNLIPSEKQQEAIKGSLTKWISMITGGPGTGKTAIMSEIIRLASQMGKNTLCLSFTGAATSRIRETTTEHGVFDMTKIMTINMAITIANQIMEIKPDYILIDEISMVSSGLMAELISAFKRLNCHFILIGDDNQLEPINWGNFMERILATPITKFCLTENFRSDETIISICKDIIDKERILNHKDVNWNRPSDDYRFMEGDLPILEQLLAYYARSFQMNDCLTMEQNMEAFNSYRDKFTIISPYVKVCESINPIFQKYFMSHIKEKTTIDDINYYLGDRVMKLVNDYGINVMNGEQGKVIKVTSNYVVCQFRGKTETITPYVERTKFAAMKAFVKYNKIRFSPYEITKDGQKKEKSMDQIQIEVCQLRDIYLNTTCISTNSYNNSTNNGPSFRDTPKDIMELYFELLEEYPQAMYNIQEEAEFLNIKQICHAYALTTHKSQGSQYEYVIFFLNGKFNVFVTVNNIYTAVSRAKKHLDIISSSVELLNSACLTRQRYVNDKLTSRINSLMPEEEVSKLKPEENHILIEITDEQVSVDDCDFDDFDMCY